MNVSILLRDNPNIILFDGVCRLCSGWVHFAYKRDIKQTFKFVSVQSETGKALLSWCGLPTDHYDTMVYIEQGTFYTRSEAFFKITQHFPFPWPIVRYGSLIPQSIRNWLYDRIALNRYHLFGKTAVCFLPSDELSKRFL